MARRKSKALVPISKQEMQNNIQDELAEIASKAARPYFKMAAVIAGHITDEDVVAASKQTMREAPIFMHMVKDFMGAQIKTNARERAEKKSVNIFVGSVNLPPRREIRDAEVIEIDEAEQGRRDDE